MHFNGRKAAKNKESPEKAAFSTQIPYRCGMSVIYKERFLCENHFFKIDNFFPVFLREIGLPAVYDQL